MIKLSLKQTTSSTKEIIHRMVDGEVFWNEDGNTVYFYNPLLGLFYHNFKSGKRDHLFIPCNKSYYEALDTQQNREYFAVLMIELILCNPSWRKE